MSPEYIIDLFCSFLAVVIVLTLHEFAHSFVAYKCGDPTPKWNGRLSLNPLRHFDPLGLVCFAFVGFGWAKPVPINPNNFRHYRKGIILTSAAGVIVNYLSAFLFYPLHILVLKYGAGLGEVGLLFAYDFTYYLFAYSLSFCVFNLLPFYPLDGFHVFEGFSKRRGKVYRFLRQYGYYILLGLIAESFICNTFVDFGVYQMDNFNILGWIMRFATNIFGWPITTLWGLIPW